MEASEHGNRDSGDVLKRNEISLSLSSNDVGVVIREDLEAVLPHVLSVVENRLDGSTIWLVAHVDGKAVIVIKLGVVVDEEASDSLTRDGEVGAEESADP